MPKYDKPSFLSKSIGNVMIMLLTRLGISAGGANTLTVKGRKSGEPRSVPVNPLDHEGARYLVAPRGNTEWVRNLRAAGEGELRLGSKRETIKATEVLDNAAKPAIIGAYLQNWSNVTKEWFGVDENATPVELAKIAPDHPVFRITS